MNPLIRFHWRPLIPGERDAELLWGIVLGSSGLLAMAWICSGVPTPLCPLHAVTGIPCPTCGMTRGLRCLLRGDLASAFLFNPLGMVILFGLASYLLYAVIVVIARLPRLRWERISPATATFLRICAVILVVMNWIYLIAHEKVIVALR